MKQKNLGKMNFQFSVFNFKFLNKLSLLGQGFRI